jgi:protoporphyrinogen oxidase
MPHDFTILGAGLAGLSAGYNLARGGKSISLIEKAGHVGGLASSFTVDGYTFDLGPHRFHTRNKRVHSQVEELLGENAHWRDRLSRIFMLGRFFDYPLKASNILRNLPPTLLVRSFADYFAVRVRNRLHPIPDDCFQNWVLKRFGATLYRLFFGTYTEKAWGMPATQISADWASQRITLLNLMDTVKKTLFRPKNVPRTLVSKFIYPMHGGVGQIAVRYAEEIRKDPRNRIVTGADVERIRWQGNRVTAVDFTAGKRAQSEEVERLISTIPLTVAIDLFDPAPPAEVIAARHALRFKAIVFVMLALEREKVTDDHWIYLPEKHLKVHRISEFKNFSQHCAPPGKTLVAAEITCNYEDEIWNMGKAELTELAARDLETVGLLKRNEVLESFIFRERYSYPLYDLEYSRHLDACLGWMKRLENFHSTGRQGLFQYGNMDHSIAMGLVLAERLLRGQGQGGADHDTLLASELSVD